MPISEEILYYRRSRFMVPVHGQLAVEALSMNRAVVGQASRLSGSAGFQPAPAGKMPALLHRQDACATCNPGSWSQCMRKKRKEALHESRGSGAGVPPAAGTSRPRIRRGRDAREDSRDGCPTTAPSLFMVPMHAQMREQATHARLEADVGVGQARRTL